MRRWDERLGLFSTEFLLQPTPMLLGRGELVGQFRDTLMQTLRAIHPIFCHSSTFVRQMAKHILTSHSSALLMVGRYFATVVV